MCIVPQAQIYAETLLELSKYKNCEIVSFWMRVFKKYNVFYEPEIE